MFEDFTFDNIMERLLDHVRDDVDKREGSIIYDALAPAALELEMAYICLDYVLNQGFADTSERDYLILRARERGLVPYDATAAILKGVFTPATVDVTGLRFSLGELNFVATAAIEGEPGAYQMTCETPGADGNKVLGAMIPIEYIDGLATATATEILIPGEDEEETEDFRARYFDSFGDKGYGGNVQDYIDKVSALDGVGGVRVTPVWNGPRTVLCTILDANYNPATSTLINSVQEAIDPTQDGSGVGIAPIDHVVTIDTPATVTVNVNVPLEFDTGYTWDNMGAVVRQTIENYMLELRTAWKNYKSGVGTVVRVSQIETRLLSLTGVLDIGETKINGVAGNLTITGNDIPVLGVITHAES